MLFFAPRVHHKEATVEPDPTLFVVIVMCVNVVIGVDGIVTVV